MVSVYGVKKGKKGKNNKEQSDAHGGHRFT